MHTCIGDVQMKTNVVKMQPFPKQHVMELLGWPIVSSMSEWNEVHRQPSTCGQRVCDPLGFVRILPNTFSWVFQTFFLKMKVFFLDCISGIHNIFPDHLVIQRMPLIQFFKVSNWTNCCQFWSKGCLSGQLLSQLRKIKWKPWKPRILWNH